MAEAAHTKGPATRTVPDGCFSSFYLLHAGRDQSIFKLAGEVASLARRSCYCAGFDGLLIVLSL